MVISLVCRVEWFQSKRHNFNSISNSDKTLAQTIKLNLVNILFKNILNKMMRKAKICKIPIQKWPNYIINTKLKVGIIFIKLWELAFNYKAKWSTKANLYYESIEIFAITLRLIHHYLYKVKVSCDNEINVAFCYDLTATAVCLWRPYSRD